MSAVPTRPNLSKLRYTEWQALLRLSGEAHEIVDGSFKRREHVCNGLSKLIGACATNLFEIDLVTDPKTFRAVSDYELCGTLVGQEKLLRPYLTEGLALTDPAVGRFVATKKQVGQSADYASKRDWEASEQFQRIRRPAGIDHQIYANLSAGRRTFAFGLHRHSGEKAFTVRDVQMVEAMVALCPQAFGLTSALLSGQTTQSVITADPLSTILPPRLKPVFQALLGGDGSKQIAVKLGLSRHTVLEYTKQLYRRLNVNGRNELMANFVERDGTPQRRYADRLM